MNTMKTQRRKNMTTLKNFYHNLPDKELGADLSEIPRLIKEYPNAKVDDKYEIYHHPHKTKVHLNIRLDKNWEQTLDIPITENDDSVTSYHVNTTLNIGVKI